ncbi:hypothetical protein [Pseudonocardia acidicola]|uniref:Uncharacterized protein n=1 Tax=Pseudonocardia acidicola TaxID=2724939 RepID=A0ABX1SGC4_9PSEU|nr:hypothetical protein [Pseudonocardia acidicola]NMI00616.1 hypothetical protein [Pseudonocardia acidicola]
MEGQLLDRVAARFGRVETRQRFTRFPRGMLAELPRKTCWSTAEHAGEPSPDGMGAPAQPGPVGHRSPAPSQCWGERVGACLF